MPATDRVFSRGQATVHGIAAAWWLGMTLLGVFGDCRPRDHDGQCGMSLMFATILGALGALTLLVFTGPFRARWPKQLRGAGAGAFLAGILALLLCIPVGLMVEGSQTWQAAMVSTRSPLPAMRIGVFG